MPALLNQGRTFMRDALRGVAGNFVTHVGVTQDATAFAVGQTVIDPAGDVVANRLIKAATFTVVDFQTLDATMSITGDTEFTGKVINTISLLKGATRTDPFSRSVRGTGLGIGVQAGDNFTVGNRLVVEDNTP